MTTDKNLNQAAQQAYGKNYDDLFPAQQGKVLLDHGNQLADTAEKALGKTKKA